MVTKDTSYGSETYRPYLDIEKIIDIQSAGSVNREHDPNYQHSFLVLNSNIQLVGILIHSYTSSHTVMHSHTVPYIPPISHVSLCIPMLRIGLVRGLAAHLMQNKYLLSTT